MKTDGEQLTITLARLSDAGGLAIMSRDLIEWGLGWTWNPRRIAKSIRNRDTSVIVARDGTQIAGFAIMQFHESRGHLNLLAVHPAWRRRGLGRRLVQWLEESARVAGLLEVHLEVRAENTAARAFYSAVGYRYVALVPGYYQGMEPAVRMVHRLAVTSPPSGGEPLYFPL